MKNWQEDLLRMHDSINCEHALFKRISVVAKNLGFDYCAYGLQIPTSLSNPKIVLLNNYAAEWQARYANQNYLSIDPTVQHARRSQQPIIWTEELFATSARALWDDANAVGLRVGWAQSSITTTGAAGMLTLARSSEHFSPRERASKEIKMRWLVNISHFTLSRIFISQAVKKIDPNLTAREIEILKWTADGKTSSEISDILSISENTVNFHIKNATAKLQTANKTAAVVRACMLGLLS